MAADNHPQNHGPFHFQKGEFWSGDLGLTLVSIALIIFVFVILPMHKSGLPGRFCFDVVMIALMVSGALTTGTNRLTTFVAIAAVLLGTVALWVAIFHPTPFFQRASSVFGLLAVLIYIRIVLLVMFRQGPITWSRIQGGGSVYLLLGLAWSSAYQLLQQLRGGAFHFVTPPEDASDLSAKLIYFSLSTLTTVGFGDVTAVHPFARSLATAEAVVGQLFPAVLIAALVSMALQSRRAA